MFKKVLASVIGGVCVLAALQVQAAEQQVNHIDVNVYVPADNFSVNIFNENWPTSAIPFTYNPLTAKFNNWAKTLQIINTVTGSEVKASVVKVAASHLTDTAVTPLELITSIDGMDLPDFTGIGSGVVIRSDGGDNPTFANLILGVANPDIGLPIAGDYSGAVSYVFDLVPSAKH